MSGGSDRMVVEQDPDSSGPVGPAGGDLSGNYPNPMVVGLQGRPVSAAAPSVGDVLTWNGSAWVPAAASSTLEAAGSALAVGVSVYRNGSDQMLAEDGTYATVKDAFSGFTTTTAAAVGNPVGVAGNGARATGLVGLTIGDGYYVSAGVLIDESGIAAFVAGAASGTWYRFVGTADTTTSLKQAWGEPQQVP